MKLLGVLVVAMTACADDEPNPHAITTCDPPQMFAGEPIRCEAACADMPAHVGVVCSATKPNGEVLTCGNTFIYTETGERGCCVLRPGNDDPDAEQRVGFLACD